MIISLEVFYPKGDDHAKNIVFVLMAHGTIRTKTKTPIVLRIRLMSTNCFCSWMARSPWTACAMPMSRKRN
jgi:hypothetical protein